MAFLQPFDVMNDGGGSGFDAAMIAIDRRILIPTAPIAERAGNQSGCYYRQPAIRHHRAG